MGFYRNSDPFAFLSLHECFRRHLMVIHSFWFSTKIALFTELFCFDFQLLKTHFYAYKQTISI